MATYKEIQHWVKKNMAGRSKRAGLPIARKFTGYLSIPLLTAWE